MGQFNNHADMKTNDNQNNVTVDSVTINGKVRNPALVNPDYTPTAMGCLVLADILIANAEAAVDDIECVAVDQVRVMAAGRGAC